MICHLPNNTVSFCKPCSIYEGGKSTALHKGIVMYSASAATVTAHRSSPCSIMLPFSPRRIILHPLDRQAQLLGKRPQFSGQTASVCPGRFSREVFMPVEWGLHSKQNLREAVMQPRLNQKYLLQLPSSVRQFCPRGSLGFSTVSVCFYVGRLVVRTRSLLFFLQVLFRDVAKWTCQFSKGPTRKNSEGHEGGLSQPHICTIFTS